MDREYVIAFYIRLSLEDKDSHENGKDESNSIANQRELLYDFIRSQEELKNCTVIELCDDGYSGTNFERPAVKELLSRVRKNTVNCIIVKDFSRFGRDYLMVSDYVDQIFPFLGIRFISVNDGYDSADCNGTTSGVDVAFRNVVYAYYSKDISEKVRTAKRAKAQNGKFIGSIAPIGYLKSEQDRNQLIVDQDSAPIIRRIFSMAAMGMSALEIAKIFNDEKIPTPSEIKISQGYSPDHWAGIAPERQWKSDKITLILRDERYLGKNVYGKRSPIEVGSCRTRKNWRDTWIVVDNSHEPIVTEEEFQAAQKALKAYREKEVQITQPFLFQKKLRCGICGYAMTYVKRPAAKFHCATKYLGKDYGCMNGYIKEADLSEVVFTAIQKYCKALLENAAICRHDNSKKKMLTIREQIAACQEKSAKFDEQKAALYDQKAEGRISREQYLSKRDNLTCQQEKLAEKSEKLSKELRDLEKQQATSTPRKKEIQNYLSAECLTREMLDAFVDCIYVYGEHSIQIQWLFDEI